MSPGAILVTGGAGYVGAHACKALRRAGYTPFVFDNLSTGHKSFVRLGPFVPGDIRDTDAVRHTIGAYQVGAVLHFAASDPPVFVADASLSHEELGFAPRLSDLKTIVETAWAWHRRAHPRLADTRLVIPSVEIRNSTPLL